MNFIFLKGSVLLPYYCLLYFQSQSNSEAEIMSCHYWQNSQTQKIMVFPFNKGCRQSTYQQKKLWKHMQTHDYTCTYIWNRGRIKPVLTNFNSSLLPISLLINFMYLWFCSYTRPYAVPGAWYNVGLGFFFIFWGYTLNVTLLKAAAHWNSLCISKTNLTLPSTLFKTLCLKDWVC